MGDQAKEVRLSLRLPRELAEAIRDLAQEHDRSINGEIVRAVRAYVEQQGQAGRGSKER